MSREAFEPWGPFWTGIVWSHAGNIPDWANLDVFTCPRTMDRVFHIDDGDGFVSEVGRVPASVLVRACPSAPVVIGFDWLALNEARRSFRERRALL